MASTKAIHELKNELSSVLAHLASTGEEVHITKHGKVVARLLPPEAAGVRFGVGVSADVQPVSVDELQWSEDEIARMFEASIEPE